MKDVELQVHVKKAVHGDLLSLQYVIETVDPRLLKFCFALARDIHLAMDLRQDTMIRVLENIQSVREPEKFMGWIFQTARNLFLDHLKSPKNAYHVGLTEAHLDVESDRSEARLSLQQLVKNLEEIDSKILMLIEMHGYSYEEAADIIGTTEGSVRSRLHRTRRKIKRDDYI